jgi:hypothetical protein
MKPILSIAALSLVVSCEPARMSERSNGISDAALKKCPITHANGSSPPGERYSPEHHGNGKLWTVLWPNGLVEFGPGRPGMIGENGVLGMKFPWWRDDSVRGSLEITGRRLDGDAPPAFGDVPDGYGSTGFQASGIFFPTVGCWEITGSVGDAELTFVQYVRVIQ